MKRILFLLSLIQATLLASAYDIKVDGIYYNITSDNTVAVTYNSLETFGSFSIGNGFSSGNEEYKGNMVVPASIDYKGKKYAVTSIGEYAFFHCPLLMSVTLPSSIVTIEDGAFNSCPALKSIEIPEGVKEVGAAFNLCVNLKSIVLPSTVTKVHLFIIDSSNNVEEIVCKAPTPPIFFWGDRYESAAINIQEKNLFGKCALIVPKRSIKSYQRADVWKEFSSISPYFLDGRG